MTKTLAATMLAALALTATPASAGCVDELVDKDPIVERHPDGSVTVHPPNTVFADLGRFVTCVV